MTTSGNTEANVQSAVLAGAPVGRVEAKTSSRATTIPFILKKALLSAFVALVLFSLMIGIRTEAGPTGELTYWTRFGELAAIVVAVFGGSIVIELVRLWLGPAGAAELVPPAVQNAIAISGRFIAPALLVFTFLVPVIFYNQRYILDLAILVLTYVMLGWGLNVVVGLAGLLDLGYVAFYAVAPIPTHCLRPISACHSGSVCRWPASSPPSGA